MSSKESKPSVMELLLAKGKNQRHLADAAGVDPRTARKWVHGEQPYCQPVWKFFELADWLEVEPRDLAEAFRLAYEDRQNSKPSPKG
jgi:transcriptional regulator with XRE-family HTH domain